MYSFDFNRFKVNSFDKKKGFHLKLKPFFYIIKQLTLQSQPQLPPHLTDLKALVQLH